MMFKMMKSTAVIALVSGSTMAMAESTPSPLAGDLSGNISVLSSYNLRGITNTPENSEATLQGGLTYTLDSGFYAGWWTSTLGENAYAGSPNALENNFFAGYNGAINDDLGFTVGTTYYYYYDIGTSNADGLELLLGLKYKDVGVTAQTLLEDTTWGNAGDTYFKAAYSYALPKNFSLDTALGLYYYKQSGDFIPDAATKNDFGFRHLDVGLSKELGDTGAKASMLYTFGGYDRMDVKQKNKVSFGLSYNF